LLARSAGDADRADMADELSVHVRRADRRNPVERVDRGLDDDCATGDEDLEQGARRSEADAEVEAFV